MSLPVVLGFLALDVLIVAALVWYFRSQLARHRARAASSTFLRSRQAELVLFPGEIGTLGFQWARQGVGFLLKCGPSRCSLRAAAPDDIVLDPLRLRWDWDGRELEIQVSEPAGGVVNDLLRKNLERISRLTPAAGGVVEVRMRDVVVRRSAGLPDERQMPVFANLATGLALRFLRTCRLRGVEILEAGATGEGACPVCGDSLHGESVRCAKCQAPHHRDCWDYVGFCATFACGGVEFIGSSLRDS